MAAYPSQFEDPRRGQVWAVVYVGLESWAAAFGSAGISWSTPDIPSFVHDVIMPVEASMWESVEVPVEAFRSWWALWRVKNMMIHRSEAATWESPKGKGDLWDEGEMEIGDTVIIGTWITKPVLDDYNKQAAPDLKIPTLTELAKMIVTIWGLPETESFDPKAKKMGKEKPPVRRFGAKTSRAVFVPDDEASPAAAADSGQTVLQGLDERGQAPSSKGMGNDPKSNTSKEETPVTHEGNRLPNGVTSVPPEASQDSGNVRGGSGDNPGRSNRDGSRRCARALQGRLGGALRCHCLSRAAVSPLPRLRRPGLETSQEQGRAV